MPRQRTGLAGPAENHVTSGTEAEPRQQPESATTDAAGRQWLEHWRSGPERTRWTELPVQAGDPAPSLELIEARSATVTPLSSTWEAGPALLLFWRHFGCSCGRDRAARLVHEYQAFRDAGATVALIGQGEPDRTLFYASANGLPEDLPLFCDPDERAYRAYGLLEGGPPEVLFDAPDEYLRCETAAGIGLAEARREAGRPMVDNPWLLPGEFVVSPEGRLVSTYRFQFCEHWLDARVNLAAIRVAAGDLPPMYGQDA